MGSMSVLSCRSFMFVSCVHPVTVLNAAFCMTCKVIGDLVYARPGAGQYPPEDQDC